MNNQPLNTEEIRRDIKKKHGEFINQYGMQIEKVSADHQLGVASAISKIKFVLGIFEKEHIVDVQEDLTEPKPCKKIRLSKKDSGNYIDVITNGDSVCITGTNYETYMGELVPYKVKFSNIQDAEFDWNQFAKALLEQIHVVIYESNKVYAAKLANLFESHLQKPKKMKSKNLRD